MQTLSYGYKKPENPDTGDAFYPALEENIQQLNDHNHDGITSAPLSVKAQSANSAAWVAAPIGGGLYRQLITLPAGYTYDNIDLWFKLSSGELVYPTVERVSGSTFYIYTNNNALTYTVYYR